VSRECLAFPTGKVEDATYLRRVCGYFSIVEAVRLHCLLGDYTTALATLSQINLAHKVRAANGPPSLAPSLHSLAATCLLHCALLVQYVPYAACRVDAPRCG